MKLLYQLIKCKDTTFPQMHKTPTCFYTTFSYETFFHETFFHKTFFHKTHTYLISFL